MASPRFIVASAVISKKAAFSIAFFQGSSVASWKTRPIRRAFTASCGETSATRISPSDGVISPAMTFSSVLLPHPEGPIRETKLPFGTARLMSLRAR